MPPDASRGATPDVTVPALAARPGGLADRFAGARGTSPPRAVFFAALIGGFALLAAVSIAARAARHRRARPVHGVGVRRRALRRVAGGAPHAGPRPTLGGRLRGRAARRCFRSSPALIAIVCALAAPLADRGVRGVRPRGRVGDLPRDVARRPPRAPVRAPARGSAGRRELPVRAHGGLDRGLRRPRAAAHVADHRPQRAHRRVGARRRCCPSSSRCRACTAGCTIRSTWPAACVIGIGAIAVLLFACRSAGCAQRLRPRAHAGAAGERGPRDARRGRRACRQDARRRPSGAAPRARGRGDRRRRSWYEVPKAKKAPAQVERALEEGAELVFAWGGDGMVRRCVGVMAGADAELAVLPAGTSNLFATNLGIPKDIEAAVRDRAARRDAAARRRPLQGRALRRDGGRRLRRRR